ncbi:hypothetical protein ACTA71_005061 [Dictyostelium dimigraforme]
MTKSKDKIITKIEKKSEKGYLEQKIDALNNDLKSISNLNIRKSLFDFNILKLTFQQNFENNSSLSSMFSTSTTISSSTTTTTSTITNTTAISSSTTMTNKNKRFNQEEESKILLNSKD